MRVLICAATAAEAVACKRGIAKNSDNSKFEVLHTGMGLHRARKKLEKELKDRNKKSLRSATLLPDLIVSTGFAGTFDSDLVVGSWVYASKILLWINPPSTEVSVIQHKVENEEVINKFITSSLIESKQVTVLSSPLLVSYDPAFKTQLAEYGQVAVDMESAALCRIAQEFQIPFVVVRIVTDTPHSPLPPFVYNFAEALNRDTSLNTKHRARVFGRGAAELIGNPRSVLRFVANSLNWSKELEAGWRKIAKGAAQ